ncbi:MAG TPA: sulfur carrier protein ThiS adenylyltransferase ThiF [Sporomusaceae bacterium]|nr:sulfur carrier protein ThiS adenylyltransferase ThiF [Sporomusaceae bacterium]
MSVLEQGLLRYLKPEVIAKLHSVKIGIAGAGGLGSNCAQMLVRTGFINFKIVDFDCIESSNLNRQFFFSHQVGLPKVEALRDNLRLINEAVAVEALQLKGDHDNAAGLFADCNVVVEAFDRPEYKKLIVETYLHSAELLVAVSGLAGWGKSEDIRIHRRKENFYVVGDWVSAISDDCRPLAPQVHVAAAKQADIIVAHYLGK